MFLSRYGWEKRANRNADMSFPNKQNGSHNPHSYSAQEYICVKRYKNKIPLEYVLSNNISLCMCQVE